jgi:hypothetical protein
VNLQESGLPNKMQKILRLVQFAGMGSAASTGWMICRALVWASLFFSDGHADGSAADSTRQSGLPPGSWGVNAQTPFNGHALASIGAQWVRLTLRWEDIEKGAAGKYDWSATEKILSSYLDDNHLHVIGILAIDHLNPLYVESVADKVRVSRAIAEWIGATANHFKGRGIIWEIGNEPEVFPMGNYWNDPITYTKMARLSAEAIKLADPAGKTAVLSLAWMDRNYATAALNAGLLGGGNVDYLSFHGYHRKSIEPESGLAEDVAWLRSSAALATPKGTRVPVVIDTETGYSLAPLESPKDVNSWRVIVYSEEAQAAYLARHFIEEINLGIPISIWYKDMNGESGFSLYYADSSSALGLRPMGRAFRTLSALLPQDPLSLRNSRYEVSIEPRDRAAHEPRKNERSPRLFARSFLRTGADGQHALAIAVWNAVEAFEGRILVSRTFTATQCFERWRPVSPEDQVSLQTQVTIAGLAQKSIREIRLLRLPDGDSAGTTNAIDSIATFDRNSTMLKVIANPMPTMILIMLNGE